MSFKQVFLTTRIISQEISLYVVCPLCLIMDIEGNALCVWIMDIGENCNQGQEAV